MPVVTPEEYREMYHMVFHGGSGLTIEEIHKTLGYGVVKMNIDTDNQYAHTRSNIDHVLTNYRSVLEVDGEVGDKKAYDPRFYLPEAGQEMTARVVDARKRPESAGQTPG